MTPKTLLHDLSLSSRRRRNLDRIRQRARRHRRALGRGTIELLEERTLLATFLVTSTGDNGDDANPTPGSLRAAILASNANPPAPGTTNTIDFQISGSGVQTIQPAGAGLPFITQPVLVDGWSQGGPGYTGNPLIELDGTGGLETDGSAGPSLGLAITASNTTVRGFIVNRFVTARWIQTGGSFVDAYGIYATGNSDVIQGCFVGTDASGEVALPNLNGMLITGANDLVGSNGDGINDAAEGNLISGNMAPHEGTGVVANGTGIVVVGNIIGLDLTGMNRLPNTVGVGITGPSIVGYDGKALVPAAQRNVVSGNTQVGIAATGGVVIAGNYVGLNKDGTSVLDSQGTLLGNGVGGIPGTTAGIAAGDHVFVGTNADGHNDAAERNVITGNPLCGVSMGTNDVVAGNYIGISPDGTTGLQSSNLTTFGVVFPNGSQDNRLGTDGLKGSGNDVAERNVIANCNTDVTFGDGSSDNVVAGNYIGLNAAGTNPGGGSNGIFVYGTNNIIGASGTGSAEDERNVISGSTGSQVAVFGVNGIQVVGNYIGLDPTGARAITSPFDASGIDVKTYGAATTDQIASNFVAGFSNNFAMRFFQTSSVSVVNNVLGLATDLKTVLESQHEVIVQDSTDITFQNNTIVPSDTTTAVASSTNPSVFGQSVTLTATVIVDSPGSAALLSPSGTVTFYDGGQPIGTGTLGVVNGQDVATLTTSALSVSGHTITAAYTSGDTYFHPSPVSPAIVQTVNPANTSTILSSSINPSFFGQGVTFTATIGVVAPGSTAVASPSGTVTFTDNGQSLGTVGLSLVGGVPTATLTTAALAGGNHAIVASYSGDGSFNPSQGTLTQTVLYSIEILDPKASGALTLSGNAHIAVPGAVAVDSSSPSAITASDSATLSASLVQVVGGVTTSGKAQISPAPSTGATSLSDPLADTIPAPSGLSSQMSFKLSGKSTLTIGPGIYGQITVSDGASLTLTPGVYVMAGGGFTVTGNASVTGNGVTIENAGSSFPSPGGSYGGLTLSGTGSFHLSPSTSGPYAGLLIVQPGANTRALNLSGNGAMGVSGVIYAPGAQLYESGNSQLTGQISAIVDRLNLSGNAGLAQVAQGSDGTADSSSSIADTLLAGDLKVYVDTSSGDFTPDELSRIQDAIVSVDALLVPYSVTITQVSDPSLANVVLTAGTTSASGGLAQGVLGCYDGSSNTITMITGWNWYDGSDTTQIGPDQYDFQTVVTHELGHALGLGGSADTGSAMNEVLPPGATRRTMTAADLNIPYDDGNGPDPETAGALPGAAKTAPVVVSVPSGMVHQGPSPATSTVLGWTTPITIVGPVPSASLATTLEVRNAGIRRHARRPMRESHRPTHAPQATLGAHAWHGARTAINAEVWRS